MPIYDPAQSISYLKDFMILFRPGDIVKWRPIDRPEFDQIVADVDAGKFVPRMREVDFSLEDFERDIDGYNKKLEETLYGH